MAGMSPEAIAFLQAVDKEAKEAAKKGGAKAAAAVRNRYRSMDSTNPNQGKAGAVGARQSSELKAAATRAVANRISVSGSGSASSSSPKSRSIGGKTPYVLSSETGGPGGGPSYVTRDGKRVLKDSGRLEQPTTSPRGTMRRFNSRTNKYETWDATGKKWK